MNRSLEPITIRVSEAVAWTVFGADVHEQDAIPLYQVAKLVAYTVGARFTAFAVELYPRWMGIGHAVELYFDATPAQRRQIAGGLAYQGLEVVAAEPAWAMSRC